MREKPELKIFVFYLAFIVVAEAVTSFIDPSYGLFVHSVVLLSLLALSAFWHGANPTSNLFLGLSLAPLIRIISLSLPLAYFPRYAWYLVASVPVLAATATVIRVQGLSLRDVGVTLNKPFAQVGIPLAGVPFGFVEYHILKPEPLALGLSPLGFALLALAFIFSTGFVEELIFRGVLQKNAIEAFGKGPGIMGVTAVFTALHIGWLSLLDLLFVFTISLFFAFCVLKTGSIIGVSLCHGIENVVLFLLMP
ncbi:MAG: CPBP family intramembrane metalloprotease [Thermoflexus sp.]